MTDREKLTGLFDALNVNSRETPKSLIGGDRKFCFNGDGEIEKIIDYVDGKTYKGE